MTAASPAPYDVDHPIDPGPLSPCSDVGSFPATRHSVVARLASQDLETRRVAFDVLVSAYWRPIYKYVRLKWRAGRDDAADLTQEFFARAFEKGSLSQFDPRRARFRTYLRVLLDGFVANERKAAGRIKRGGEIAFVSLDFAAAENELVHGGAWHGAQPQLSAVDDDAIFRQEWVRTLFADAVEQMRQTLVASGKRTHFAIFERYDLAGDDAAERATYASLAREFGIPTTQVTNYLALARRELRRTVLERLRALCASDEEFALEAREVLGVDPT